MTLLQETKKKDPYEDILQAVKSLAKNPKLHKAHKNPSISKVLSLTEDDITTVWEEFQFAISKQEMYSRDSPAIQPVLDNMRKLSIVGENRELKHFFSRINERVFIYIFDSAQEWSRRRVGRS